MQPSELSSERDVNINSRITQLRLRGNVPSKSSFFVQKWIQCSPKVPATRYVKKIKGTAHKSSDVDGMCKRTLTKNDV